MSFGTKVYYPRMVPGPVAKSAKTPVLAWPGAKRDPYKPIQKEEIWFPGGVVLVKKVPASAGVPGVATQ